MVGLVIVSHSRALAAGVAALVKGVSETQIPLAFAGGAGDEHGELGTDATDIMEAIQQVDSPQGVVVLMDLGSAILSAETAIEFLEGMLSGPVRMVPAPLVEGAVSAAVQIGLGSDIDTVVSEALDSLSPKREQLGFEAQGHDGAAGAEGAGTETAGTDGVSQVFTVATEHGLHARPAANLARTVGQFSAAADIRRVPGDGPWVNARSLNRIATLQVRKGDTFELRASGADAKDLLAAVAALVEDNFGEAPAQVASREEPQDSSQGDRPADRPVELPRNIDGVISGTVTGAAASRGLASGPAFVLTGVGVSIDRDALGPRKKELSDDHLEEQRRTLARALEELTTRLTRESEAARRAGQMEAAEIADAHVTLLSDPELEAAAVEHLRQWDCSAAEAFWLAAEDVSGEYRAMDDPYLRVRAADVQDVARRLVQILAPDLVEESPLPQEPAILLAADLLPSQTMRLDPALVRGIVTTQGSASSHAAIIARGLGLPMVAAAPLPTGWEQELNGVTVIVDGVAGTVEIAPEESRAAMVREQIREQAERREAERRSAEAPARLADGTPIAVRGNVATAADAAAAAENHAEGVGLLRTEFMFLGSDHVPSEDEQVAALKPMLDPFGEAPVTVRLLDIGGDKAVAQLNLPREDNPFLGLRGVRLLLDPAHQDLLRSHLRAVLRAAVGHTVKVMVPMVAAVEELEALRRELNAAHTALEDDGVPHQWPVELGIMVETPAAALRSGDFAGEADFFSLGTNDLTQYVMAAERGNAAVAYLSQGLPPAVLTAIQATVAGAAATGTPVSVCGEMGSDEDAIPVLIGLGVTALSVNPAAVAHTKAVVSRLSMEECRSRAEQALE